MADSAAHQADDPTIADEAPLWRRVPPCHVIFDQNLGRFRPSSAAFENHPNGTPMSVLLGGELVDSGRSAESILSGYHDFSLVSFPALVARNNGQAIVRRPLPDEPAHAEVVGRKSGAVKKALVRASEWVVPPAQANPA